MKEPLGRLMQTMIPAVEREMRSVLLVGEKDDDLFYGMMHYHLGWVDEQLRVVQAGSGKRVRPLLCLLVASSAGGDWQQAIPGGSAIELIHNFSLIHDDIQDASLTRRGRPTMWEIWGANQAINSGDAMFSLAHIALSRMLERGVPAEVVVHGLRRLDETCLDLTMGQYLDMSFESKLEVTVEEYLEMIQGKTAALLAYSAELGARVAQQPFEVVEHYALFGRDLGLAFQVRDDILGIWGDESVIGKSSATDIATRKKSLPVLFGLERSNKLRQLYAADESGDDFVQQVVDVLDSVGARQVAESYEERYASSALEHLQAAHPQGEAADALNQLTELLLNRDS
ncbi:MAG: polyprenyl synthetase family protein [Chloroflexota bacterium]